MGDQQLLTKDDYVELLKIRFNNPDIKFKEAEYDSQTEKMEGFLGEHNILKIKYSLNEEIHTANFFVKSKPKLQSSVDLADKLCMYEKEIFLYDKLMRIFENRGYNTCFAPKCYLCKDNGTLVMQDLKSEGYYLAERNDFFDLDKIKSSLKALAHFHGASFIYEEEKSKELNRNFRLGPEYPEELSERFLVFKDKESIGYSYFYNTVTSFVKLIKVFDETDEWKQQFQQLLSNVNFQDIFTCDLGTRNSLGHGDLWTNNMLFNQQNDELQCCIVDYQIMRYYNPAFDVNYLIFTNTRKELRDSHFDTLLDYYFDSLKQVLKQHNISLDNIYSKEEFIKSINHYKFLARFQSAIAHTYTFIDANKLKLILEKSLDDFINDDRSAVILEAFKYDNFFAGLIKENLYDMRDMLLSININ